MKRHLAIAVAALVAACGAFGSSDDDDDDVPKPAPAKPDASMSSGEAGSSSGSGTSDGSVVPHGCDPHAAFTAVNAVASLDAAGDEGHPTLTEDELTIFYTHQNVNQTVVEILTATRPSLGEPFVKGAIGQPISTYEMTHPGVAAPWLSPDKLTLFLAVYGTDFQIVVSKRANADGVFGTPAGVPSVNSAASDTNASLGAQTGRMYFDRTNTAGGTKTQNIVAADVADRDVPTFKTPLNLLVGTTPLAGKSAVLDRSESVIYYSAQVNALQVDDVHMFVADLDRNTLQVTNAKEVPMLDVLNMPNHQSNPAWLSPDACRLYFTSGTGMKPVIYVASRQP